MTCLYLFSIVFLLLPGDLHPLAQSVLYVLITSSMRLVILITFSSAKRGPTTCKHKGMPLNLLRSSSV